MDLPSEVVKACIKQTMFIRINRKNQILDDIKRLNSQKKK
jgi:hypothetical protein